MPKVLWLCAVTYMAAVWTSAWLCPSPSTARLACLIAVLVVQICLLTRRWLVGGLLVLAMTTGVMAPADLPRLPHRSQLDPILPTGPQREAVIITTVIVDEGKPGSSGVLFPSQLLSLQRSDGQGGCLSEPIELGLWFRVSPSQPVLPGDILRLRAIVRPNPSLHLDRADLIEPPLSTRSAPLLAYTDDEFVTIPSTLPTRCPVSWDVRWLSAVRRPFSRLRNRLLARINAIPATDESRAVLSALTLGWRGDLFAVDLARRSHSRPSLTSEFSDAGISHILSVSGLHLALVGWLAYRVLASLLVRVSGLAQLFATRRLAAALTIPIVLGYSALTGAELPTVRAACVLTLWLAAAMCGRRTTLWQGLALSILIVGSPFPQGGSLRLCDPSWLLSIAATIGISFLRPLDGLRPKISRLQHRPRLARSLRWLLAALDATLGATILSAPIGAIFFGRFVATGILANLLLVPIGELLVLPLGLVGLGLSSVSMWLGSKLLWLALTATTVFVWLTAQFARHGLVFTVPAPPLAWLGLFGLGIVLWIRRYPSGRLVCALALVGYLVDWQRSKTDLRLTALSVGQGDSLVVEFPNRQVMVIDAGPASDDGHDAGLSTVTPFLRRRGISHIDWLVMTHAHPDHSGGLPTLLREFSVGELWWNPLPQPASAATTVQQAHELRAAETTIAQLEKLAAARKTRLVAPHAISVPSVTIEPLIDQTSTSPGQSLNNGSVVLRLRYGGRTLLLTGDIEAEREAELLASGQLGKVDVLKAPHHCSKTSSTEEFVLRTRPRYVICSVGRDNRFGFPHPAVVQRYKEVESEILRTDELGSLTLVASENGTLTVLRALAPRFFF